MGGRIVADSVEGKGTRFTVTLPLKETSLHCA
jgi:signal transduction histidine kinase